MTSEEGNDQCQAIGKPYTNCSLNFLGGTHEMANMIWLMDDGTCIDVLIE